MSSLNKSKSPKAVMYHDGECPICRIEVNAMQKMDTSQAIKWVDISTDTDALEAAGLSYQTAMARVHVQDGNQQMLTGVHGFLVVWQHLPYYRRLVPIIRRTPLLLPLMEVLYTVFAKYRLPITGKKPLPESQGDRNES